MKEVKFRLWDNSCNKLFYDSFVIYPSGHVEYPDGGWDIGGYYLEKESYSLMQYTGLKDKNGTEIYEGDILKVTIHDWDDDVDCYGIVYWNVDSICWDILWYEGLTSDAERIKEWSKFEVIGNIFENRDLVSNVDGIDYIIKLSF